MLNDFIETYLSLLAIIGCISLWAGGWFAAFVVADRYGGTWWALGVLWVALTLTIPAGIALYKIRNN